MSERADNPVSVAHARLRMLLVEDSEDDAFLLYSELAARGPAPDFRRVDCAEDMAAALATADWDVIICDHQMPGFDSESALDVLKQSGKDITFIVYSGQYSEQQVVTAMREGVSDCVPKGRVERLLPVIERELRGAAARRAVRQADHRINALAFYDELSSLPNRNLFCARLSESISGSGRSAAEACGAVYVIDLDRFLRINGSFGYEVGNEMLRQVARRLHECVERSAILARLGSDEFAIFYPGLRNAETAMVFSQWLLQAFDAPFRKGNLELYLTPSIGVAVLPDHGMDADDLVMNAETAMAVAKRAGGNGARLFAREMNASSAECLAMESDLRHALERGEFFLQFQPIIDTRSGFTYGAEALLRWRHPTRGLVKPDQFIPLADETGLIVDIGEWVLESACTHGRALHDYGYSTLSVTVNVSAVQFAQPRLLETVCAVLERTGFAPQRLVLEITESVLMRDAESAIGMLRALKALGVQISVDDFGTGYSSLSYLKRLPIDVLKIDRSFVRGVVSDHEDAAIVQAILALGQSLGLSTVAEGVENAAQAELLARKGCEFFQGFHFARPLDPQALLARLHGESAGTGASIH